MILLLEFHIQQWSQVAKCQDCGVSVILCIGETLDERHGPTEPQTEV